MTTTEQIVACDVVEQIIRGLIKTIKNPVAVSVGIHNAFIHGECFLKQGLTVSDSTLTKLFKGLDLCNNAMHEIAQDSGLE
jgi:hypothetical protein